MAQSNDQLKPAPVQTAQLRGGNAAAGGQAMPGSAVFQAAAAQASPGQMRSRAKRRSSRRLQMVKVGLPLVALGTLSYLGYWWYVHNRETVITVETARDNVPTQSIVTVNNFKYASIDDKNRPYTITATTATQPQEGAGKDIITLTKPQADISLANNAWMAVTAKNGLYHRDSDLVDLSGDVTLFHDNGMSFRTDTAHVDLKAKIAEGSDPVQGQNQNWELTSEGFRVLNNGNLIIFTGRSHMKIFGNGKDGNG